MALIKLWAGGTKRGEFQTAWQKVAKSKVPETRQLPALTPRHALPRAYAAAAISPIDARYLRYSQLNKVYATPKGPLTVVEDFNLILKKGEFISLIASSRDD